MNPYNSHTHCQVAPADPQAKTWQRVCLFQRTTDRQSERKKNTERTTAVWRNGGFSASYDSFVVGSSVVLRLNFCAKNLPLRQAAKRWGLYEMNIARAILTIGLVFLFCQLFGQSDGSTNSQRHKTASFDCAVFNENYFALVGGQPFTPTFEEVERAEKALQDELEKLNSQKINQGKHLGPIVHKNLSRYRRQYFGYIAENGDRILFINAFWKQSGRFENWLVDRIVVHDGGSRYWSVKFNLSTGELFELWVNGVS